MYIAPTAEEILEQIRMILDRKGVDASVKVAEIRLVVTV